MNIMLVTSLRINSDDPGEKLAMGSAMRVIKSMLLLLLLVASVNGYAADTTTGVQSTGEVLPVMETGNPEVNTEQHLPHDETYTPWLQQTESNKEVKDQVELKKVLEQEANTVKLENVVPPIHFKSGQADIPENYVELLRKVLDGMKHRANVRLHFVGHTDNIQLRGASKQKYGNNAGLSMERAGTTAEFFQRALNLPPEAISFEGAGDSKPIASNKTEAGRQKNRRVEVQVWYDEITEKMVDKTVRIKEEMKRIKMCRIETVCKLRYKEGHSRRARLRNLVPPLRYDENVSQIPEQYIQQLRRALDNLKDKSNVQIKFIGHTDNTPLAGRFGRIYGDHVGLSKARSRRVALSVQEALRLPNSAIDSDGRGSARPVASNESETGRAVNRRVEVEFWHDDALEDLPDEPQLCPESAAAETVTLVYDPPAGNVKPVYFDKGQPVIPPGYVERLKRIMEEVRDKGNVRIRFTGYTNNDRLDRRTAMVYGDDIGLSTARARRVMESIRQQSGLSDKQLEFEGKGFVHSDDVVNEGFIELDNSRVEARIVYDDLALLEEQDGVEIDRIVREVETKNPFALNMMRISVDGNPVDDPNKSIPDVQRCTDVALDKAELQVRYDSLQLKPRLNVTAWPNVVRYRDNLDTSFPENLVSFQVYTNYSSLISKYEIRIFEKDKSTRDIPLAVIEVGKDGTAEWLAKLNNYQAPGIEVQYLLRVYDSKGQFDETSPQPIWLVDSLEDKYQDMDRKKELLVGFGENRLAMQNIEIRGGTVRVNGKAIPKDHSVWFAGHNLPVSAEGEFASEEIIPSGLHTVEVAVLNPSGNGQLYLRDLKLDASDWFYVGIADITASQDSTNGPAALITGDQTHYDNDLAVDGRLAFYTRGKFGDNWKLTASADTREGPLEDIFSNFMDKAPDSVFRRMDPDYYQPTYGDDSSTEETAPTMGKFYLKLQQDSNHLLWGNFNIGYTDNNLAHVDRSLYGANLHYENDTTTSFGEKKVMADIFAAEPGTLAGRDEFRGTGGSLYYLRHQDILTGSDRLRIEVRDKVSGMVLAVKNLTSALDYDVDYIQGRILLRDPLSPSSADKLVVDSGSGGNEVYLVARYEYTPGFADLNDLSTGGRLHFWVNDYVKLGLTSSEQGNDTSKQSLQGTDITLRKNAGTWIKLETAASEGAGNETMLSSDGGYSFGQGTPLLGTDVEAGAQRIDASVQLSDVFDGVKGRITLYNQQLEAGYSAPGLVAQTDTQQNGMSLDYPVLDNLRVKLKTDARDQQNALETSATELNVDYDINENWVTSLGYRQDSRTDHSLVVPLTQKQGDRNDLALKATYDSKQKWSLYGFIQDTVKTTGNREENARTGMGGEYRVTDHFKLNGELSGGDLGEAARLGTEYLVSDRTNLYLNYTLDNERADNGLRARKGNLSSGFKTRYSDSASIYFEERYTHGDVPTGLTHAFGIDLAPADHWSTGLTVDVGSLQDNITAAVTERTAATVKLGYSSDNVKYSGAVEYRLDNREDPATALFSERTTMLYRNSFSYQYNPNWRMIGKLNHSTSESTLGEFYNGNFTEAVLGYAYRPVDSDGLNALFKYTYFYNLPAADQITLTNTSAEYIQKSHIVSLDFLYDLGQHWSIGGKYAHRFGQISTDRVNPVFFDSTADLYIVRLDWHMSHRWDALLESRVLSLPDAGDTRSGALIGVYRHLGQNIKLGAGYNFTDFSDDLTDLDYDSQGVFINFIAKM